MGWVDVLRRDPEERRFRELRRAFDTASRAGGGVLAGGRMARGELWPAMPARYRTPEEQRTMDQLADDERVLVEAAIDTFLSWSQSPALISLMDRPAPFLILAGFPFGGWVEVRLDRELRHAPLGFVDYLAAYAVAATPSHLLLPEPDSPPSWPSRSAMARIRRHLATTGDYPAPNGWTYAASTQLRNAYYVIAHDCHARYRTGSRLTAEMAEWADAQPDPYNPRHYPSWRGRFVVQEAELEIWGTSF